MYIMSPLLMQVTSAKDVARKHALKRTEAYHSEAYQSLPLYCEKMPASVEVCDHRRCLWL